MTGLAWEVIQLLQVSLGQRHYAINPGIATGEISWRSDSCDQDTRQEPCDQAKHDPLLCIIFAGMDSKCISDHAQDDRGCQQSLANGVYLAEVATTDERTGSEYQHSG